MNNHNAEMLQHSTFEQHNCYNHKNKKIWIQFGSAQVFEICIADCRYVQDLIDVVKKHLGKTEHYYDLCLLVQDANGFKGKHQQPGKLLSKLLQENPTSGRSVQEPLLVRKTNPSQWSPIKKKRISWSFFHLHQIKVRLYSEWSSISWFTSAMVGFCILELKPFSIFSASFSFIVLKVLTYIFLSNKSSLVSRHFTCSRENFDNKRYWTLVSSSLSHVDINHLLCNISSLLIGGPLFESIVGLKVTIVFFCAASVASNLASLKVHGHPSMGSSGVIYAMDGFLIRYNIFEWKHYVIGQVLFYWATNNQRIDHVAHVGGFVFGYLLYGML